MKAIASSASSALVACAFVCTASMAAAQPTVGALAVDERQGDQYGWAVDYETAGAAQAAALGECGSGCSVVLTFERCAAYAADQDADSTAVGWAESYGSSTAAQQGALTECSSRGGTGCIVRVWGCNGPVVEEGLGLDAASRRRVQEGLRAAGFDPGGADGVFGPRTRTAIRGWQSSRGSRATGYLDGSSVVALRSSGPGQPTFRQRPASGAREQPSSPPPPAATAEQETVFWQSIANSTNPAEFEAYLRRFPSGMFSELAQIRLETLRGAVGSPASGSRPAVGNSGAGPAAGVDVRGRPGAVFRSGPTCAGQPAGTSCWMGISGRSGCYVWNPGLQPGATVTWTACVGGVAEGTGTLTWTVAAGIQADTGRLEGGRQTGDWVLRQADGTVSEGPYVDGERRGHWIARFASGNVGEGPMVNGQQTGHWVFRTPDGTVVEGPLLDGERHGEWVVRRPDGRVEVQRWENGERVDR